MRVLFIDAVLVFAAYIVQGGGCVYQYESWKYEAMGEDLTIESM
jgi:hypothetical protein